MVNNYLPPDSQPWARFVEGELKKVSRDVRSIQGTVKKTLPRGGGLSLPEISISTPKTAGEGIIFEGDPATRAISYNWEFPEEPYVLHVSFEATGYGGGFSVLENGRPVYEHVPDDFDVSSEEPDPFDLRVPYPDLIIEDGTDGEVVDVTEYWMPPTGTIEFESPDASLTITNLKIEVVARYSNTVTISTIGSEPTISGTTAMGAVIDLSSQIDPEAVEQGFLETAAGLAEARSEFNTQMSTLETGLASADERITTVSQEAQASFDTLDQRLSSLSINDVSALRAELASVLSAAEGAQATADQAVSAAGAAEQAALKAAGIADAKGKVIYSESEPSVEDRSSSNLWIQPSTEKTFTWTGSEWDELTSDTVSKAAQDALDAKQAAATAQNAAEQAKAEAASALAAAQAAQRTADQSVLDAQDAHNAAVEAQETADDALAKYGPLDQRTLDAQKASEAAQARADAAYQLAEDKADSAEVAVLRASVNGKNSITISTAEPSGVGVVAGDVWWRVTSGGDIFGQWRWDGSAWLPVLIRNEVLAGLDVHKLQVTGDAKIAEAVINKLFTEVIVAKVAKLQQLVVSSRNLIPQVDSLAGLDLTADEVAVSPLREFGIDTSDPSVWVQGRHTKYIWAKVPIRAGEQYRLSVEARTDKPGSAFSMDFVTFSVDGAPTSSGWTNWTNVQGEGTGTDASISSATYPLQSRTIAGNSWQEHSVTMTATADGIVTLRVWANHANGTDTTGYQWFKNLRFVNLADGNVIVDGAIEARHVTMDSAWVDKLLATDIKARMVTSEEFRTLGSFEGTNVVLNNEGVTVVGATSYSGVWLDKDGLTALNREGAITVKISSDGDAQFSGNISASTITGSTITGSTITGGTFYSGNFPSYPHVMINDSIPIATDYGEESRSGISFPASASMVAPPSIATNGAKQSVWSTGALFMRSGRWNNDEDWSEFTLGRNRTSWRLNRPLHTSPSYITMDGGSLKIFASNYMYVRASQTLRVHQNAIPSSTASMPSVGAFWNSKLNVLQLFRVATSRREAKTNIVPFTETDQVLDLEPRVYHDRAQWEEYDENGGEEPRANLGLIVDEVQDAGMDELILYDETGAGGIAYDRLAVALLPTIKKIANYLDKEHPEWRK